MYYIYHIRLGMRVQRRSRRPRTLVYLKNWVFFRSQTSWSWFMCKLSAGTGAYNEANCRQNIPLAQRDVSFSGETVIFFFYFFKFCRPMLLYGPAHAEERKKIWPAQKSKAIFRHFRVADCCVQYFFFFSVLFWRCAEKQYHPP